MSHAPIFCYEKWALPRAPGRRSTGSSSPEKRFTSFLRASRIKEQSFSLQTVIPSWSHSLIATPRPLSELCEWLQRRPPLWIRARSDVQDLVTELRRLDLQPTLHRQLPQALSLGNPRINLYELDCFRQGAFEVQDIASQTVSLICDPRPGERWWDACAGAGGKTLHLASLMQGKGSIVATDRISTRLDELKRRARRAGISNVRCRVWEGGSVDRRRSQFDGVLVDAPCSTSGTWRRNPDARWSTGKDEIKDLASLQGKLLSSAAGSVRRDGRLVYATCSLFSQENEAVVERFLANHSDFTLEEFQTPPRQQLLRWDGANLALG